MNTLEIISNFMKANTVVTISEKQRSWLVGQAKKENLLVNNGWYDCIYFEDCFYQVRQCKTLASGGSYVGSRSIQVLQKTQSIQQYTSIQIYNILQGKI